jgi:peptidoglycan/LPS O-acetylase OafA/YrhL
MNRTPSAQRETAFATSGYRLGYRADIEGLRALAILLVVASHAGVPGLEGGYIGVDMFFVLSGYLITGLLVQEVRTTNRIRLTEFYGRRLKRLLPALLFMIVCISCAAMVLLPPFDQPEQADTARAATVWASNLAFAFGDLDYFSHGADQNLFLHTWSLGVEEQFYLIWPLLLLFFLGQFRPQGKQRDFRRLRVGLFATVGTCLVMSLFLSRTQPLWDFYLMPARAWQFALGAIVLLWTSSDGLLLVATRTRDAAPGRRRYSLWAGWIGLGMIVAAILFLDRKTAYPGAWALLPSLGTACLLFSGAAQNSAGVTRLLATGPMQRLGRISYSWYLWHWPVLVLGAATLTAAGPVTRTMLVAISLALAVFSYRFVENPIRRNTRLSLRPAVVVGAAAILMGGSVVASTGWKDTAVSWMKTPAMQRYIKVREDVPVIYAMGCDTWFRNADIRACIFGDKNAGHTAVLLGDSIVGQWFPAFQAVFDKPGWRIVVFTKSACPMVDEPWFYERIGMVYTVCNQWRDAVLTILASVKPDVVLTGSAATYDFNESQWIEGTERVLAKLAPVAGKVFIIMGTPGLGFDGPSCLAGRDWRPGFMSTEIDCSRSVNPRHQVLVQNWLTRAAARFDNISVLDLNSLVCPHNRCYAEQNRTIVFRDGQHLTAGFATTLGNALAQRIATDDPGKPHGNVR